MSNFGADIQKGAYGDTRQAELTPIAQINAIYNIGDQAEAFEGFGGVVTATDAVFRCTTSTDPNSFAGVLSRRSVTYRAGQGLLARFSAVFGTPAAVNRQQAGFTSNTDALMFGYDGTTFGVLREHGGFAEVQTLTVTVAAAGAENATVTVDGVGYTVPLTAGTVEHNAQEIAESLHAQVPLQRIAANGATVVTVGFFATPLGSFAFTSGTAVAAWVQTTAGVTPIREHIPQASWNVDPMPSLDPTLGNVYQIQTQWLGFGNVNFYVEDPEDGRFRLVHRLKYPNTSVTPSLSNPTLKVGWFNGNAGGVTGTTLSGSSAAGFVEGKLMYHGNPRSAEAENVAVTSTEENLIAIRNRWDYGSRANKVEAQLTAISMASDSTKITHIALYKNATITGTHEWEYIDQDQSIIEVCRTVTAVTGGTLIGTNVIGPGQSQLIILSEMAPLLEPGETYVVTAHVTSGAASEVVVDLSWKELK